MSSDKKSLENVEHLEATQTSRTEEFVEEDGHISARTVIAVVAVSFLAFNQQIIVVGSGFTSQASASLLGDVSKASWLSSILTICNLAFNPILSQAADYWGRKWIVVFTAMLGVVGAIIVSRAQNIATLIGGFCVLGMIYAPASILFAIPSEILPRRYRAMGQASVNIGLGVGGVVSLLMGGSLLRHGVLENYRIYWYIVAGMNFLGSAGVVIGYNPPLRELQTTLTFSEKFRRLDWGGFPLYTPGVVLFSIALQYSNNPYSWSDPQVLGPFIPGMLLLIAFAIYEWRFTKTGIFDHQLFTERNATVALVAIFAEGLLFFGQNSYVVIEIMTLKRLGSFEATLRFLLSFCASTTFAVLSALYTTYTKRVRDPLLFGFVALTVTNGALSCVKPNWNVDVFWGFPVLLGVGMGSLLTVIPTAIQLATPPEMISVATGVWYWMRGFGGMIGIAVNTALYNNAISSNAPSKVAAAVLPLGFPADSLESLIQALLSQQPEAIAHVPNITPEVSAVAGDAILDAYAIAFRHVWLAAVGFSAFGAVTCLFFHNPKDKFTGHIDAPADEGVKR
ncbi:putative siderophore iron transporter [Cadophora sp. MPI-SDFR-AT-0126]|nr:putative siderophore iron transporter [Leotiomycetes sp. MPI-SDFR-AT-0126]